MRQERKKHQRYCKQAASLYRDQHRNKYLMQAFHIENRVEEGIYNNKTDIIITHYKILYKDVRNAYILNIIILISKRSAAPHMFDLITSSIQVICN